MKRFLALTLILMLFCTAAFAAGKKEEKQTMDAVVTYAKSVAAIIAYNADDPVSGAAEDVEIGGIGEYRQRGNQNNLLPGGYTLVTEL